MSIDNFDKQFERIDNILSKADKDNILEVLKRWRDYLDKVLTFPFDALIQGDMDKGPLNSGDQVSVKKIEMIDDLYGIIIELRLGRKKFHHPLDDVEVVDKDSPNQQPLNDYSVWMANH